MLRTISYLNLMLAVGYFLAYLQNGSPLVVGGLISVVVFNWLVLRKLEMDIFRADFWLALFAAASVCFVGYITYGAVIMLMDAAEYQYYPAATLVLSAVALLFSSSVIFHLFISFRKISRKKDD